MGANDNISKPRKETEVKVKPYPGSLPKKSILPEKLAKANELLRSVKDLDISLQNFKK